VKRTCFAKEVVKHHADAISNLYITGTRPYPQLQSIRWIFAESAYAIKYGEKPEYRVPGTYTNCSDYHITCLLVEGIVSLR